MVLAPLNISTQVSESISTYFILDFIALSWFLKINLSEVRSHWYLSNKLSPDLSRQLTRVEIMTKYKV